MMAAARRDRHLPHRSFWYGVADAGRRPSGAAPDPRNLGKTALNESSMIPGA
jgi:hypothetical protein